MRDSRKQQMSGSLHSLPSGSVRRSLPGRVGLPGVAAATGLALLLSACGGGGGGAGAPDSGAGLGGSASSIQMNAAIAPAPVVEKATPDARNTASVAGNTPSPVRNTPPDAGKTPPPAVPPPVAQTILPPIRESPARATARSASTDPSTLPFPSGTDETVNMNTFGQWGLPAYQPGGFQENLNNGPNVVVRRRADRRYRSLTLPISGGSGEFAYDSISYGSVNIFDTWLTYPADAGDGDLAVHVRARKVLTTSGGNQKGWVMDWLEAAARLGPYYGFTVEDFFLTEAYLQAPGSGVQPAPQGSETSATWTGKVIAVDSAAKSYLSRGDEIGGDARVTVHFGASPTVDVSLTDLRSAWSVSGQGSDPNGGFAPYRYPNQSWTGLALSGGAFSDDSPRRTITGAFRSQVESTGTNANTVGGIFDVFGTMKGGFVATIAPPTPGL